MNVTSRPVRWSVACLAVGLLVGCGDGGDPVGLLPDEAARDEVVLDEAATSLSGQEGEMAVEVERGVERDRRRRHDRARHHRHDVDRVRLAVGLGSTAVGLAARILHDEGADEAQLRLLESAARFQEQAEAALAEGHAARAVAMAGKACWTALKAVVLPGGITEEEARFVHELAEERLRGARAEVEGGGSAVEVVLLRWAARFFEIGSAQLAEGDVHGLAALWKSAVVSSWILG